ncbi:MAG: metallophosphoesterase, partial [Bacteroidaceae bacterium]|nr:metallophosphoesterase [Bacteroidaceae bacterium]
AGDENPVIVMDHQPTEIALADSLGAQMVFCGHTHRGQLWPLTWLTDALFEQSHGYRHWQNAHAYVSQGLSLWGPPFRIGSHSEVVVFHLHSAP